MMIKFSQNFHFTFEEYLRTISFTMAIQFVLEEGVNILPLTVAIDPVYLKKKKGLTKYFLS